MPIIILNATIQNKDAIKGMKRRWAAVLREALKGTAICWMENIFPKHFTAGNAREYHHEARSKFYKIVIKREEGIGGGKEYDDILKGRSMREMWASATVTGTQNYAMLRLKAPAYFTDPYIGKVDKEITDKRTGERRQITINITRQPDKVREVTEFSEADRNYLQEFLEGYISLKVHLALMP